MNEFLHDRIMRKLSTLSDERLYQVLDYVEFLESRYAERPAESPNVFQRFAETVEDRLRSGRVSAQTIGETMGLLNRAMGVLNGVAAAGASVAKDVKGVYDAATRPPPGGSAGGTAGAGAAGTSGATAGTSPARPPGVPVPPASAAPASSDPAAGHPSGDASGGATGGAPPQPPRTPPTS